MTSKRFLATLLLAATLVPVYAAGQYVAEDADPDEVLAVVHFDPATYELYRPWADKWFEELANPAAPHRRRTLEGDEFQYQGSYRLPVEWIRTILSTPATRENDDKGFALTVLLPSHRQYDRGTYAFVLENLVLAVFYEKHGFAEVAFQSKQMEIEGKAGEFEQAAESVQGEIDSILQELQRDRREISDETLQAQIAAIEEGPKLELEMNLAEMAARRQTIIDLPASTIVAVSKLSEERSALEEERIAIERKLDEIKLQFKSGTLSEFDLKLVTAEAEKRLAELRETISGLADKAADVSERFLSDQLKQMLIETEVNLAGLEARRNVLLDQYEQLKARLAMRVQMQEKIDELNVRKSELQAKAQETYGSLSADEFRTPRPVIEWVPEPEKPAQ